MKFIPGWSALGLAGRIAAGLAVLLILLALWWVIIGRPAHDRHAAAEAKVSGVFSQSHDASATDAARINDAAHDSAAQSDQLSRENADAIHHAPGAAAPLDPALNAVGRGRLCDRPAYSGRPECLQRSDRAKP